MSLTKPRARRAEMITPEEHDCHHWLGRLAMCLAISSHEMPDHLRNHARKTLDDFCGSSACSDTLAAYVKDAR